MLAMTIRGGRAFIHGFVSGGKEHHTWSVCVVAAARNLSLYYVNSMKYMVRERWGENEGLSMGDLPFTQRILGSSQARHLYLGKKRKHGRSHEGSMFWGVFP